MGEPPQPQTPNPIQPKPRSDRDFLTHLEAYLSKRDGVDKLLKISRYASKIIIASSLLHDQNPLSNRLKSFESSVGVSRKAFRLGKFVQNLNSLRNSTFSSNEQRVLSIVAYGSEGLYYFVEQFIWLSKSGLIDVKHSKGLGKISAWFEFLGYFGSVALKIGDLREIGEVERRLRSGIEIAVLRGGGVGKEEEEMVKVKEKRLMKVVSIVQDLADGVMAFADIRDGKGWLVGDPIVLGFAGLLSAVISTHKNWVSC